MGWFSWLPGMSEKKEEKPPEPLVLGATLSCIYGSQDSYLDLDTNGLDINGLPEACVEDCVVNKNISPFGKCHVGEMCEYQIAIEGIWQNPEPQKVMKNGKEIITTKSILKCKEASEPFTIKNSGQDGGHAKDILFIRYVKIEYPNLYKILEDQYGSLYLEGNYEEGIEFLSKRLNANNGEIEIINMYDPNNIEGKFILATLERLLVDCKTKSFEDFMEALEHTATQNEMNNLSGWDKNNLNLTMIELLKQDCKKTAERIDNDPAYRAMEKHKVFSSWGAESMNTIAYTTVLTASAMAAMNTGKGNTSQKSSNQNSTDPNSTTQKSTIPAKVKDSKNVSTEGTGDVVKGKGAFNGEVTNGEGFGKLANKEIAVTQKGFDKVKNHISSNGFDAPENSAMINRIETALNNGEKLKGADASYYMHELKESTLMGTGLSYEEAHVAALKTYQVSPFSVYHPEVIQQNPSDWGKPWFNFWGIDK